MSAAIARELTCRRLVELVTDCLEDQLSTDENRRFDLHVCSCSNCRIYLAQMRAVMRVAGHLAARGVPGAIHDDLLQAFRTWKRA
jgi:hypothetical protein